MGTLSYELYASSQRLAEADRKLSEYELSSGILGNVILDQLYDECGGTKLLRGNATGFFHVGKINGTSWIIDPSGNAFICKAVNHVSYEGDYAPSLGYSPYNRAVSKKYGSSGNWARAAVERMRSFGFNTIGAWSSDDAFTKGMPYTIILNIATAAGSEWLSGKLADFFSSKFESAAYELAERLCLPRKDDPYLLGYFTDNELRWSPDWRSPDHLIVDYLSLPPEAEGKRALVEYLRGRYREIDALNVAWNTSFNSFDDVLSLNAPPKGNALESDALGFLEILSRRYFQVCHDAIREYDPNHLILGCRYALKPPDEALRGSIGYSDVISINNYGDEPPLNDLRSINALTGLPIMITEFSFKAMDSGLPNTKGAGVPLRTQGERADHYEKYVKELISEPYVVGYHWFEYTDEPAEGRFDGENSNYGLVDIADDPWTILVTRVTAINLQAEILHLQAGNNTLTFFVSPDGDDRWSGRLQSPSPSRTDGPFATISRVQEAIRQLKAIGGHQRAVAVLIRGGTYFLSEPLLFTANDSGTDSCNITYISYPGETPILSGGRPITGWRQVTVGGRQLWAADVPEAQESKWPFHELWVNGQRRIRARHPNTGYLRVAELPDVTNETQWTEGQRRFRFHEGDMVAWETATEAEIVVMNRWVESRLPIVSINEAENLITFSKSSTFRLDPGDLYYVENAFELLGSAGEWYLNRTAGILYYLPMPDEDMAKAEVIAPVLSQLMILEGKPEAGQLVEHIIFRGLTFAHTGWNLPPEISGYTQAAVGIPGAIYGVGISNCAFESCAFEHLGTYALELSRGCRDNVVAGCDIGDIGAGGIKVGEGTIRNDEAEQTHGNDILDCHIHDGGLVFHSAVGIWMGQSYDNRIAHNWIHDFYYTGISIGWTWGYGPSSARGNVVEFNEVNNIGVRSNGDGPILSDMGGIYTLGIREGTIIRFNLFHDIAGLRYGGWGIYLDEGSTQAVVEGNVVYKTTHGGFHQHYGRENVVRNNIFAFGRDAQIQRTRAEPHVSFTFMRNIIYWRDGDLLTGRFDDLNFTFDYNLYWREDDGDVNFSGLSLDEWRSRGMDSHSLIEDPLFVDPDNGGFTLKDNSPAFSLGFRPIDTSTIGPRTSAKKIPG